MRRLQAALSTVETYRVPGLGAAGTEAIFAHKALSLNNEQLNEIATRYGGNALALQLASSYISDVIQGDVEAFLALGSGIFGDIKDLIGEHDRKLNPIERMLLQWISLSLEACPLEDLSQKVGGLHSKAQVLTTLEGLISKSLVIGSNTGFDVHPLIRQYFSDLLVDESVSELMLQTSSNILTNFLLVEPTSKDYVRAAQRQIYVRQIASAVLSACDVRAVEANINELLASSRGSLAMTYRPSNLVAIMAEAGIHFRGGSPRRPNLHQMRLRGP